MKNTTFFFLIFLVLGSSSSVLNAQENILNPGSLLFSTTPPSTQSSSYGINGINLQNGFNSGIFSSNLMQVGSDLLFAQSNGSTFSIQTNAQFPGSFMNLDLSSLAFRIDGFGSGLEEWKIRTIDKPGGNGFTKYFQITREYEAPEGGATFFTVLSIDPDNNNFGIGITPTADASCKLNVGGTVCSNNIALNSDRRFKKNIRTIKNAAEKLSQLEGVSYAFRTDEFKDRNFSEGKHLGLIAQDLEKVFPELVWTSKTGYKAVYYEGLIPVLIEAFKEKEAETEQQQAEISRLNEELSVLQSEVEALKRMVLALNNSSVTTTPVTSTLNKAQLFQNEPNPFEGQTIIQYFIPTTANKALLKISTIDGQLLQSIPITTKNMGQTTLRIDSLRSGVYIYSLVVDGRVIDTKKMVVKK